MKTATLKLCLLVVAITTPNNVASLIIPPFLQQLQFPVAMIGSLVSLGPVLALASRVPAGVAYSKDRARLLITMGMITMAVCNFLYSFATDSLTFALVHTVNGFAYGGVTTLYMAFYVDSLPPDENRNHAMGYYVGSLAVGYSTGNFFAGYLADRFGYEITFHVAALMSFVCPALIWFVGDSSKREIVKEKSLRPLRLDSESLSTRCLSRIWPAS